MATNVTVIQDPVLIVKSLATATAVPARPTTAETYRVPNPSTASVPDFTTYVDISNVIDLSTDLTLVEQVGTSPNVALAGFDFSQNAPIKGSASITGNILIQSDQSPDGLEVIKGLVTGDRSVEFILTQEENIDTAGSFDFTATGDSGLWGYGTVQGAITRFLAGQRVSATTFQIGIQLLDTIN